MTLFSFSVYSQSKSPEKAIHLNRGSVWDGNTRRPLEGVNIYLYKDSVGIGVTDSYGNFEIAKLKSVGSNDPIVFSYVGYRTIKRTMQQLQQDNYLVYLYEQSQTLSEVTVTAEERPYYLDYTTMSPLPIALYSFGS